MIYLFNTDGRCVRKSNNVKSQGDVKEISLLLADLGADHPYVITDLEYKISEIYMAPGRRITRRVTIPATFDPGTMTIVGLPIPCAATIDGNYYESHDGSMELALAFPGVYVVLLQAWPYLDTHIKVEVA